MEEFLEKCPSERSEESHLRLPRLWLAMTDSTYIMIEELKAITKTYDLIMWCLPQIIKFPRVHRFTVGERMENLLFDILENLISAKYTREKLMILKEANLKLEKLRYFVRICKDMNIYPERLMKDDETLNKLKEAIKITLNFSEL